MPELHPVLAGESDTDLGLADESDTDLGLTGEPLDAGLPPAPTEAPHAPAARMTASEVAPATAERTPVTAERATDEEDPLVLSGRNRDQTAQRQQGTPQAK